MNIEDIKIEDAADANYVIRKFFNDQLTDIKMSQLEQLVLTVYNMGKNKAASATCATSVVSAASPESSPELNKTEVNPFKINDKVKTIEDIEIGNSGIIIKANTAGTVSSVNEDTVSFLFESSEDGEMIDASVLFNKLEKIT